MEQCKRYGIKEYDHKLMKDLAKLIEEARTNPELKEEILNSNIVDCDSGAQVCKRAKELQKKLVKQK